jgi:cyclophilin family peptidyl-prolyl cis-trans isomerase/HEAT repeat protein
VSLRLGWLLVPLVAVARAEPPVAVADHAAILRVEMRRGPAKELARFLEPETPPLARQFAIRALGRIGDRGDATAMLAALLERGGQDLPLVLWSAGLARAPELAEPVAAHLASEDPLVVAAAARALGRIGGDGAADRLAGLLLHPSAPLRAAALAGLARARAEACLERAARFLFDDDETVRSEAELACWSLAAARRRAAQALNVEWDGDAGLARAFVPLLADGDPDRRLGGVRPLGLLLPGKVEIPEVRALLDDPEPRVVQEAVSRIFGPRADRDALARALDHDDEKVRRLAIEALDGEGAADLLYVRFDKEQDARLLELLAARLAELGNDDPWYRLQRTPREVDPVLVQTTDARVRLASEREEALPELRTAMASYHPAVQALVLREWGERDGLAPLLGDALDRDWYVAANAIEQIGSRRIMALLPRLLDLEPEHPDVRQALVGALAELAADERCGDEARARIRERITGFLADPSAFVRAEARNAARALGLQDVPETEPGQPNDWRGLPRPRAPILGLDLTQGGPRLDELEIARLARRLVEKPPRLRVLTTAGEFVLSLDADAAPVHAASLVVAVVNGVHENTRWHRVVPSFVIQGGDPHGSGAGNAGWTVPDEISRQPFLRGALGMPKSTKDTGGCQLFVMISTYHPLDERYTCYGMVVDGMDTVDAIRVGDRILEITISE